MPGGARHPQQGRKRPLTRASWRKRRVCGRNGWRWVGHGDERWGAAQELLEASDVTEEERHADSVRLKQYLETHPLKNADECVCLHP